MNRIAARKEREERKARVENQPLGKGDTVAYEVRFAPHMPPKRTLGEVLAIGASGVKVRLVSGEELWLKRSQVEIVATRAMRRAERIRRESEDEQSRKAKEIIMTNTRPKEPLTVPENDVAPPTVTPPSAMPAVTGTIAAMRAAGQDPFAIFLAMGRGLLDDQRGEVAKADAAIAAASRQVEEAHALLAEAERELERARLAAAEARGRFAQIERAAGFAA